MKLETYRKRAFWPLNILAILFVIAFVMNNFHVQIAKDHETIFQTFDNLVWALFSIDYLIMLYLAVSRKRFIKTHVLDLILVVFPFIRIFRVFRLISLLTKQVQTVKEKIYLTVPIYTATAAAILILLGGAAIYDIEYSLDNSNIKTPSDAIWWAAVTITTVGYGDRFPVSDEGRLLGVALMICGIAVVGTVTASFAGWLISHVKEVEDETEHIKAELTEIKNILKR